MPLRLARYGRRFWAVYEDDALLCVTVYKKGARAVIERLARKEKDQGRRPPEEPTVPAGGPRMPE
jgi:hypothetical protein